MTIVLVLPHALTTEQSLAYGWYEVRCCWKEDQVILRVDRVWSHDGECERADSTRSLCTRMIIAPNPWCRTATDPLSEEEHFHPDGVGQKLNKPSSTTGEDIEPARPRFSRIPGGVTPFTWTYHAVLSRHRYCRPRCARWDRRRRVAHGALRQPVSSLIVFLTRSGSKLTIVWCDSCGFGTVSHDTNVQ